MKLFTTALGAIVALLLVALLYKHRQTTALETSMTAMTADRDTLNRELRQLSDRVTDLQRRAAAAEAQRASTAGAAVASAVAPRQPVARAGVTTTAPTGWGKNGSKPGSYVVGVDSNETWGGMPSAYVESVTPTVENGFGGMMQTTSAENFVGKRVRLSGWVKTENANEGGGHLWLRVDGQERGQMLQFDNMSDRAVKGTSDWQEASVVLDVPAGASALAYGFFVSGGGKMWVSGQRIEEVGPEVPSTNKYTPRALATKPRNLGFYPNEAK